MRLSLPLPLSLALVLIVGSVGGCATSEPDPWEKMNRGTFAFNEFADKWALEPVAKAWDFVLPEVVQKSVANFFDNVKMPIYVLNNLLQGEVQQSAIELSRFVINTTWGVGGFIDVATWADVPHYPEDFGLTLGHWGASHGPYLVLPILGASTVRDTGGLFGDAAMTLPYTWWIPIYVPVAGRATELLNKRAIYLEEVTQSREEAFDFYVFVRNAYLQNREHRLRGTTSEDAPPAEDEDDLYYFDDDDDSYDEEDDDDDASLGEPNGSSGDDSEC
jgi:phospholipid-binding lipoprotein MlaA